jgi:lipoyl(octanoyl) transferase
MQELVIQYLYLGRVDYADGLRLQADLVKLRLEERVGNTLLLLEHPPVLTLGRNANRANILASSQMLGALGVTLHEINRGGDVTWHGPGQLVGYPIFDLRNMRNPATGARLGPVDFVRLMEEALIRLCAEFGVTAERICGLTGVWCGGSPGLNCIDPAHKNKHRAPSLSQVLSRNGWEADTLSTGRINNVQSCGTKRASDPPAGERKIGAIGIHVSRGITSHGFAFNVTTDLDGFRLINPCGITDRPVTSLEKEIATRNGAAKRGPIEPELLELEPLELEPLAHRAAAQFGQVFEQPVECVDGLAELDASLSEIAQRIEDWRDAQAAPVVGVPLKIPKQIEQLRQRPEQPVRA